MKKQFSWKILCAAVATVLCVAAMALAAGCTGGPPQVSIEEARAELSPAIIGEGLVYMKIKNAGGGDTLMAVKTSIPGATADLHEMRGAFMVVAKTMRIPSKSTVELKPMGSHIMIENMPKQAKEGYQFTLTLIFKKSGEKQVALTLVKASAPMTHEHHM